MYFRPVASGGAGGARAPHFLADQLTLSQPGGAHYPHPVVRATPDFQTLRRPCMNFTSSTYQWYYLTCQIPMLEISRKELSRNASIELLNLVDDEIWEPDIEKVDFLFISILRRIFT